MRGHPKAQSDPRYERRLRWCGKPKVRVSEMVRKRIEADPRSARWCGNISSINNIYIDFRQVLFPLPVPSHHDVEPNDDPNHFYSQPQVFGTKVPHITDCGLTGWCGKISSLGPRPPPGAETYRTSPPNLGHMVRNHIEPHPHFGPKWCGNHIEDHSWLWGVLRQRDKLISFQYM